MELLKKLCKIHAPSGEEEVLRNFLIDYIKNNQSNWKTKPTLYFGKGFQDNLILVFGKPNVAVFAHMDSIGFTVKYNNEIIKIGGPKTNEGITLIGKDSKGDIEGKIFKKDKKIYIEFDRIIDRGTSLTYKIDFRENDDFIQSAYIDNRLGIYNTLEIAKNIENGILVFSTWEEHGGGSVGYLGKFIQEKYNVSKALISDITWITEGVKHGKGCVISLRDSGIPRKSFVNKIINIIKANKIPFQLEVEDAGGSDGNGLQKSDYPWDWCFIGAAEDNVHSPDEKVHKKDIESMIKIYNLLLKEL
ncbi:MAG: aminopeptidase [Flavobacteriales bacterium]|nr:aminopeptidase [Flavobacteriales bacterium]